jgi:hypothetical protein
LSLLDACWEAAQILGIEGWELAQWGTLRAVQGEKTRNSKNSKNEKNRFCLSAQNVESDKRFSPQSPRAIRAAKREFKGEYVSLIKRGGIEQADRGPTCEGYLCATSNLKEKDRSNKTRFVFKVI